MTDVFERPEWETTAWDILGKGEDVGNFFGGSMAEAVDDALSVAQAVLIGGVKTFGEFIDYEEAEGGDSRIMFPDGLTLNIKATSGEEICDVEFNPEDAEVIVSAGIKLLLTEALEHELERATDE